METYSDKGLPPIILAAGYGDIDGVERLVQSKADVNVVDPYAGANALHKACQGGHLDIVKCLLKAGALINARVHATGHTPLVEAIWFLHVDCVEYLLEKNASIYGKTSYGFTIEEHISYAIQVNQKEEEKKKLLQIKELVEKRKYKDEQLLKNPFMEAALNYGPDSLKIIEECLRSGADVDMRFPITNTFNDGHTVLLVACRENRQELADLLIQYGADVNAIEPTFGAVPLHKATYNGHEKILELLLASPDIDVDFIGFTNGYTPLHDALWHGFEECADRLIDYGASLSIKGHDGKLPYDIAKSVFGENARITKKIKDLM